MILTGVPCVVVSAAFRGHRFVSSFQEDLVLKHLPLANRIAKYFAAICRDRGPSVEELKSAAYEGLCKAALRYLEGRGRSFEAFARVWIKREVIRRVISGDGPLYRPRNAVERAHAIERLRRDLSQQRGEEISDEDLAAELMVPRPPRNHHQRSRPETAGEIRELAALLYQRSSELQAEEHAFIEHTDLDPPVPIPPVSDLLDRLLDGWTVAEVAQATRQEPVKIQARIASELRQFFRK